MNKKLLFACAAMTLFTSASAHANEFNLDVNLGGPAYVTPAYPVYAAPAPAIIVNPAVPVYYDPHHRAHDWRYWQGRRDYGHDHDHDRDRDHHWDHR